MKVSNYNFIIKNDSFIPEYIAYNSRTNALALMSETQYRAFADFLATGTMISDEKLLEDLKMGGYIIEDELNELDLLKLNLLQKRFDSKRLGLTIAPTSDCNFRCAYCYEKDSVKHPPMSKEVQESLFKMVENYAPSITSFGVTWYGGEPLLCFDIIQSLSERFLDICDQHSISYGAGIITNGYLLTPEICVEFNRLKINSVQITLDGTREQHDRRRPLKNGKGSFDRIIQNLKAIKGILPYKIALRVNTDKTNISDAKQIVDLLQREDLLNVVHPYLAKVHTANGCCSATDCYTSESFSKIFYDFEAQTDNYNPLRTYPRPKANYCGADSINSFVIDSDGRMYKCWSDIGVHNRAVGRLYNSSFSQDKTSSIFLTEYLLYDPTVDEKCSSCKLLPICMGGCPSERLQKGDRCNYLKFYIEQYMKTTVRVLKENLSK